MKLDKYLNWLRQQPCYYCGRYGCDPHHCGKHGTAKRNHDEDAMPLCSGLQGCHRKLHDGKIKIKDIVEVGKKYFKKWQEINGYLLK